MRGIIYPFFIGESIANDGLKVACPLYFNDGLKVACPLYFVPFISFLYFYVVVGVVGTVKK